ncbi:MAG: hypothetical protein IPJ32_19830 [Sphingobacteriaceae bacterium]|nr:hypothetical protein [Sphingobacteriaceae bacterium]
MNKDELKKEFKENFRALQKIINSWELIPGSPSDEFDALNHKILSHLYKGSDTDKISDVLYSEIVVFYGLDIEKEETEKFASEISEWWNQL